MVTWHLTMSLFPATMPWAGNIAKTMMSNRKQFTVNAKCWPLLHVIRACSWKWPDVVTGISPHFFKICFCFVLFCYITNHLTTGPLGNSEFCFPQISRFLSTSSPETLRLSGNKIHCSPWDQSLSVKYHQLSRRNIWTPIYWLAPNENSFIAHLKESATYIGSKFHSTDLFVYPILIMWWYPRENFLSNLDIFMPACSLFNEHDKGPNRVCIVTWSVLRKQKWQAKKFYSWIIVLAR